MWVCNFVFLTYKLPGLHSGFVDGNLPYVACFGVGIIRSLRVSCASESLFLGLRGWVCCFGVGVLLRVFCGC